MTGPEGRTQSSDGSAAKNNDQGGKKGHRRVHSLGSYLPSWVVKRTASIPSNLDKAVSALMLTWPNCLACMFAEAVMPAWLPMTYMHGKKKLHHPTACSHLDGPLTCSTC